MKQGVLFKMLGAISLKSDIRLLAVVLYTEQSEDAHSAFTDIVIYHLSLRIEEILKLLTFLNLLGFFQAHG